jgi:hypothetical protein
MKTQKHLTVTQEGDHCVIVDQRGNFFAKTYSTYDAQTIVLGVENAPNVKAMIHALVVAQNALNGYVNLSNADESEDDHQLALNAYDVVRKALSKIKEEDLLA